MNIILNTIATLIILVPAISLIAQLRDMLFGELGSWMFIAFWILPCAFVIWRIWA